MNNRVFRPMLIAAAILSAGVWMGASDPARLAAPPPPCPAIADSFTCIARVELLTKGQRRVIPSQAKWYACRTGKTRRIPTSIWLDLQAAAPCSEESLFRAPLRLVAAGRTLVRGDGVADFSGNFTIGTRDPRSQGILTSYVTGCIEILERVGSHHEVHPVPGSRQVCEPCDANPHSEGWLMGTSTRSFPPGTLRAILVGSSPFPAAKDTVATFATSIDGMWIKSR